MNSLEPIWQQLTSAEGSLLQSCAVLLSAILLARYVPIINALNPLMAFRRLAHGMATKVNKPGRANSQRQVAGIMATLCLTLPIIVASYFITSLAAYPWFFEFFILYLCLPELSFSSVAAQIQKLLANGDKAKARELLAKHVGFKTDSLSEVGIAKAIIELQLTAPLYGFISVILLFLIGGLPLVIAAKLLRQLELSWPSYHPQYQVFSSLVFALNRVIYFIPKLLWLATLSLPLGRSPMPSFNAELANRQPNNDYACHHLGAQLLGIELGGPQQFESTTKGEVTRVARDKIIAGAMPSRDTIGAATKLVSPAFYFWLALTLALPIIWFALKWIRGM
ncbi:cobalamin biosynthesis protein CbiB [Shewanella sp. WXL01]|uniref:cobalamin biosynthesis protein n=1 Tax=Shewanella sp. WXL01 TaxID=2709721 RepID=UPI00143868FE|nr:cobalamin biosynthesis protein [Shewanella sp. WXL01]NKF50921.1 cobalamin biosynthesis protein CbiB [Shewanella sp. WXL01]